jgi:hypothetical protein
MKQRTVYDQMADDREKFQASCLFLAGIAKFMSESANARTEVEDTRVRQLLGCYKDTQVEMEQFFVKVFTSAHIE